MPRGRARQLRRHFLLSLIHQTEALQESRRLGILHGLDLSLCILLAPHLCSGIMLGPDLCSRIVYRLYVSVLLHGPDLCSGILHDLCLVILDLGLGILYGLHGPDLCPCIFLVRPSLVLLE